MNDETTLLPCPFCGSEAEAIEASGGWLVQCISCFASVGQNCTEGGFLAGDYHAKAEAIETWNTRIEQAVAATLGDDEYESKMDALLCRLTNGKWSKTRSYDLDFMESCVNEEFDDLYAKELAYATFNWQAITDELNARAERTCRNDKDKWSGLAKYLFVCSECGWNLADVGNDAIDISARLMKRCPMCGARVVSE